MNLIVIKSKMTLIVRDRPYFDLPIVRMMLDRDLGDTRARPRRVNRNEAMYLAVELNVFQ